MLTRRQIIALSDKDLLTKICEEASEVIKAVCKHQVHGPTPKFKGVQYDNVRDANEEASQFNDLMFEHRMRFGTSGHKGLAHGNA
jgi:hypothetical protein